MESLGEAVLLESCCFLLNYHQEQIKRKKEKDVGEGNIFKKNKTRILP